MSRTIRIHAHGGPEELRIDTVDVGSPAPGEAKIRQTAIGINFIDVYHRTGLYPLSPLPHALGMEAAGRVLEVGEGVHDLAPGDRVAYASGPPGAYAELRCLRADRLVRLPEAIDDATAAGMMLKGMTAEYLIRRCFPVRAGQTVLVHAAAGGVGLILCQWLNALDATVIGTVGSDEKAEVARAHGCAHPIVYTREDFPTRVREITAGRGVPVVYDSVGKSTFAGSLDCLAPRGTLVVFGNASGKPEPFDLAILAQKGSLYVTRPTLMTYTERREDLVESAGALFDVVAKGLVRVPIRQRFPLVDAAAAHRELEARKTVGSTILLP